MTRTKLNRKHNNQCVGCNVAIHTNTSRITKKHSQLVFGKFVNRRPHVNSRLNCRSARKSNVVFEVIDRTISKFKILDFSKKSNVFDHQICKIHIAPNANQRQKIVKTTDNSLKIIKIPSYTTLIHHFLL